jgi:exosortase/archaeosortase family protein
MYRPQIPRGITNVRMRSLNKSGDSLRTQKPAAIASIALLLAAIPTLRWYVLRLQDGGGELAGLVPLCAALWFGLRDRKGLKRTSRGAWTGVVLLLIQAAAYPFLPAMIRALLMIAALASVSGIWRKPGIVCLLVLALPLTASLDFFLGYPLRLLTSINAGFLLEITGTDVSRTGVQLLYEGRVVGVDPACSGMNMLWSTGLLTALLAAVFSLRWRSLVPLGAAALALALAGNSLRAAILFFPEAEIINMPHILHPGIGIAIAGGGFLALMKLARRLSLHERKLPRLLQPAVAFGQAALSLPKGCDRTALERQGLIAPSPPPWQPFGRLRAASRKAAAGCSSPKPAAITIAASLVLLTSFVSEKETHQPMPDAPLLSSYHGIPLTRISLNAAEKTFYGNFPGSIAVYEAEGFKLIVRQVNRATRMLHPASHCLRAEGFSIGEKTVVADEDSTRWLSYTATRNSEIFQVKERINCPTNTQSWPEISAWYWHALFHPSDGPWEAVTVINPVRP